MFDSNKYVNADIEQIVNNEAIDWNQFVNKSVLVTGATGLIGTLVVKALLARDIKVYAAIRNEEKAKKIFNDFLDNDKLQFVIMDIMKFDTFDFDVDYIIHTASQTSSKLFVEKPVETINTTLKGTQNILSIAKEKAVKGMIFLSTMEVYGTPSTDEKIREDHPTNLDTTVVRNCYPISKRMAENLCTSYAKEYDVPVKVLRLTQTFGPGVLYNDGRVFAEFARCAIEGRDIVLHTKGETKRNYLYVADAVASILIALTKGEAGQAYNVANEATYCSIFEMAELVANDIAKGNIKVKVEVEEDLSKFGYANTLKMNLDTTKIQSLGWKPEKDLKQMFDNLSMYMKNE
ncbi:nucleotide sugar dehydratase [Kandleria vitulina DSM 20405]|uniref:Nucleotide sugar dehydratase n=1 Tax=Kandleria vitulina DSM 20405 TaxID=1410657 RepID=A0A0R2HLE4_9FIRM|nr:NAD(P)-dependent oxidoreductase [Kandleria vitulina]KRN50212.1 nucleotide sugar dehydratase [Kandleria vitulina DSM 20405]